MKLLRTLAGLSLLRSGTLLTAFAVFLGLGLLTVLAVVAVLVTRHTVDMTTPTEWPLPVLAVVAVYWLAGPEVGGAALWHLRLLGRRLQLWHWTSEHRQGWPRTPYPETPRPGEVWEAAPDRMKTDRRPWREILADLSPNRARDLAELQREERLNGRLGGLWRMVYRTKTGQGTKNKKGFSS